MAGRIDTSAFFPDIPEELPVGEKIRLIQDALTRIYEQVSFSLGNIRGQDLSASAKKEICAQAKREIVTGILAAKRWSDYPEGEIIPEGDYFWYKGELWECIAPYGRYDSYAPDSAAGSAFWSKVT